MNGAGAREGPSDEALLTEFLKGRPDAFEALVERHARDVYHFVARFVGNAALAEDVVQETFLQVHQSARGFDRSRRFKPWLFTIAANKARDQMRSRSRKREVSVDSLFEGGDGERKSLLEILSSPADEPGETVISDEQCDMVRRIVDGMPEHLKEVLLLGYYQRMAYKEIAEVLEIPLGTVKSRLHAAVAHFAAAYRRRVGEGTE